MSDTTGPKAKALAETKELFSVGLKGAGAGAILLILCYFFGKGGPVNYIVGWVGSITFAFSIFSLFGAILLYGKTIMARSKKPKPVAQ